ncbi:MAG: hypothetical protein JXQ91_18620 [Vannielia sp.]|uniref:hypothetical protein n=1 Tax=Rhodobacterales TaxID=204455 RepID=UPI002095141D|nr:hypothetical protein [Oceanicola sp. 502str15]MCO6381332.1 hypothetical protein [Oceanicola sp. 502str15]
MRLLLCLPLALAGCNTVKDDLPGHSAHRVQAMGYTFNIFAADPEFQAVRTNLGRPNARTYPVAVAMAVRQATGCEVALGSLTGDFNLTKGKMSCP